MIGDGWVKRKEAARILTDMGYPVTAEQLAQMAENNNAGAGPPFTRTGWRSVWYHINDLKSWKPPRFQQVR